MADIAIERGDGPAAWAQLDELVEVYREAYAEPPYDAGSLWEEKAFRDRTGRQVERNGFTLVTARVGGALIGFAFGLVFPAGGWWAGQAELPPAEILDPAKFAVIELVVRKAWRGRGLGHRLLDELLAGRPEPYAMLTAMREAPVRQMYARWGWQQVGTAQHTPTSPILDQLVLPLS